MSHVYPTPQEVGIKIPGHLKKERYCSGFEHALRGGQINRVEYFRLSFREGYRAGKIYLKRVRRQRGIIAFPMRGHVKLRMAN